MKWGLSQNVRLFHHSKFNVIYHINKLENEKLNKNLMLNTTKALNKIQQPFLEIYFN